MTHRLWETLENVATSAVTKRLQSIAFRCRLTYALLLTTGDDRLLPALFSQEKSIPALANKLGRYFNEIVCCRQADSRLGRQ